MLSLKILRVRAVSSTQRVNDTDDLYIIYSEVVLLLDGNLSLFLSGQIGSASLGKEQKFSWRNSPELRREGKRKCVCVLGQGGGRCIKTGGHNELWDRTFWRDSIKTLTQENCFVILNLLDVRGKRRDVCN